MSVLFEIEKAALGWCLQRPEYVDELLGKVRPEDFTGPHLLVAEALEAMTLAGVEITPLTVMERMRRHGSLNRAGGGAMLHTLDEARGGEGEWPTLVETISGEVSRRRLVEAAVKLERMAKDPMVTPEEAVAEVTDEIERAGRVSTQIEMLGWPDGDEEAEPEWVIPMLLGVDERVMITGGEGLGKSYLIRQLVSSVAVGFHPFGPDRFEPQVALHVDLENPPHVSNTAYRAIRNGLRRENIEAPPLLRRLEPRRFDITNGADLSWLLRAVRQCQPKMIGIGPLKNMTGGEDPNEERTAVKVQDALNRIRGECGAALLLEGHAGHSSRNDEQNWRPRGSSAWLGWPEVGIGMKPIEFRPIRKAQLLNWRGSRTQGRYWPEWLVESQWPWPFTEDPRIEEMR